MRAGIELLTLMQDVRGNSHQLAPINLKFANDCWVHVWRSTGVWWEHGRYVLRVHLWTSQTSPRRYAKSSPFHIYTHLPPVITPIETGIRAALRFNAYPFHTTTIPTRNIISFNILCIQHEQLSEPEWHVLMRVWEKNLNFHLRSGELASVWLNYVWGLKYLTLGIHTEISWSVTHAILFGNQCKC